MSSALMRRTVFKPESESVRECYAEVYKGLIIHDLDFLANINGPNHKTDKYDVMNRDGEDRQLVIRRGQEFYIILYLNRQYDEENDNLLINFWLDDVDPLYKDGTFVSVPVGNIREFKNQWEATVHEMTDDTVTIKIYVPGNIIIGKWHMKIHVMDEYFQRMLYFFRIGKPMYILFNPWSIDDDVFLESEDKRQEYVLADRGLVWRLQKEDPTNWSYSQFAEDILDCAMYLVTEIANLHVKYRNDPVKIARKLTAAVNGDDDDDGVLYGKWCKNKEDYKNGTAPWVWKGSDKILQQYYREKRTVSYGQCWVYAGVLTTVCRALGIPSRVVTNYSSAHDTEGGLTIDYYFNDRAEELDDETNDSLWNFHVWNEVWMTRPDIGDGQYDGWQVIDATPQEKSNGIYCCGPMSVAAIKNGDIMLPYDGKFIYSEVNADQVLWKLWGYDFWGRDRWGYDHWGYNYLKLMNIYTDSIGQHISTKAIGKWEREDITENYKHKERSKSERQAFLAALDKCNYRCSRFYENKESTTVKFDFKVSTKFNKTENSYGATLTIDNTDEDQEHKISVICCTQLKYYTGKNICESQQALRDEYTVAPGDIKVISIDLNTCVDKFRPKIIEDSNISVHCLVNVKENDFDYLMRDIIWIS